METCKQVGGYWSLVRMKKNLVAKLSIAINLVLATALVFFIFTYSNNSLVADEDIVLLNEVTTVCDLVVQDQQKKRY